MQFEEGPNLTGIDPETGEIIPLFNPRTDRWADHFAFIAGASPKLGIEIRGLTPVGRTTTRVLEMNNELRKRIRYELWREGMNLESVAE
jgi:hypothetical protein